MRPRQLGCPSPPPMWAPTLPLAIPGGGRWREKGLPAGAGCEEEEPTDQFGPLQGLGLEAVLSTCQSFHLAFPVGCPPAFPACSC